MTASPNILVVGCGSIGQRHLRNLRTLGIDKLLAFDPAQERVQAVASELGIPAVASLDDGLARQPDAVLVCTPPSLHLETALRVVCAGAHVFVEKPIAPTLEGVDDLLAAAAARGRRLMVGYNMRFHRGLRRAKELLDEGTVGRPLAIKAEFGQYLPTWRPQQDYRQGYIARAAMGGGIILDASHELDYTRWLGGEVAGISCVAGHLSALEIETEDVAAITLRLVLGGVAEVHLDCVQRGYTRTCKVIGEEGTLIWDYQQGVRLLQGSAAEWQTLAITPDPNEMYLEEMRHFLDVIQEKIDPLVDGMTGRRVLELALAAKRSAAEGREVPV